MIELRNDQLIFSFPEVHREAVLEIDFQRTLRIPDDGSDYPLPPGLGSFPLRHVDDFAERLPGRWLQHGGVMLPMYQSEAMWLNFTSIWTKLAHSTSAGRSSQIPRPDAKPWPPSPARSRRSQYEPPSRARAAAPPPTLRSK